MSFTQAPISTRVRRVYVVLVALLIFCATMLSFVNGVGGEFLNWDDDRYVTANPLVQDLSTANLKELFGGPHYYAYIPLTLLSHAIDIAVWGINPKGHHLTNIFLHAINAASLFLVMILVLNGSRLRHEASRPYLLRITASVLVAAAAGALLFAIHPQRTESVSWVSGRKDLLCAFFLLPSFGTYLVWRRAKRKRWIVFSVMLFALALLAKPVAMSFPFVLLLADLLILPREQGSPARVPVFDKLPYFALSIGAALLAWHAGPAGSVNPIGSFSLIERMAFPFYMILFYLMKFVVPLKLSPIYPEVNSFVLAVSPVLVAAMFWVGIVAMQRGYAGMFVGLLVYALMILPTFLGIASGLQPLADRYTYLSTVSLFAMVGGVIELVWRGSARTPAKNLRRVFLGGIVCMVLALSSYRTTRQIEIWHSSITLWDQALRFAPATRSEYEARKPYLKPDFLDAFVNAGTARYTKGDTTSAMQMFQRATALDSCAADAQYNIGVLLYEQGDALGAIEHFKQTVACDPLYAKAHHNLGVLHLAMGNRAAALDALRAAARLGFADSQALLEKYNLPW